MSIRITPADVGRKVRLWNEKLLRIRYWDKRSPNPVILENGDDYTDTGFYYHEGETSEKDIIAFADEPETKAPADHHKQVWLTAFTEYVKAGKGVDHSADAANAAVEAFNKFERGA